MAKENKVSYNKSLFCLITLNIEHIYSFAARAIMVKRTSSGSRFMYS